MNATASDAEDKGRKVKVTLTADVDGYVAAIERATEATKNLLACGVSIDTIDQALKGTLALADGGYWQSIDTIVIDTDDHHVTVDGQDITMWVAKKPVEITSGANGETYVTVTLAVKNARVIG
ncbi:hypothetical protein B7R22_05410 [Subtercola boreus]|uniref:Uncharacterized protein n=1 Tax=Subtercola boreus TaxID=120213 RepID=A0A3E0W202_9MICO|nr:hypothetical protein [Subtercola boreus]RFA15845.1 hypothetical protein B7R22_05410 [Subtercola boreus]